MNKNYIINKNLFLNLSEKDDRIKLEINSEDLDFVNNKNDLEMIFNFITKPEKGTRYFNPIKDLGQMLYFFIIIAVIIVFKKFFTLNKTESYEEKEFTSMSNEIQDADFEELD